ncbi:SRPBCC family protein [Actinomadura barringtoniae]|uniref:SRPBCC family protein n=1 Tax=Actinomadura barringtoniae TaxID=1427535 RepID=A0A939PE44_9ACTN|nr:SRPBCC family protein [Actinomadura barringtoniae]MBO2450557.1 SRPBCC family protein [Actinomadura barringtoniae]
MRIDQEFAVTVPLERAWAELTDLEAIAPCMPGAQLTGVDGEGVHSGTIKVKIGPIVAVYRGTARFAEKDEKAHRAVIDAGGRDSRGAGAASALITASMREDGDRTVVTVETELKISGKVAQFGSGMMKEVSAKLLGQFVDCLEKRLAAEPEPGPQPESEPAQAQVPAPAPSPEEPAYTPAHASADAGAAAPAYKPTHALPEAEPEPEQEPVNLLGVARWPIVKRLIPPAIVLVVVIVLIVIFVAM